MPACRQAPPPAHICSCQFALDPSALLRKSHKKNGRSIASPAEATKPATAAAERNTSLTAIAHDGPAAEHEPGEHRGLYSAGDGREQESVDAEEEGIGGV